MLVKFNTKVERIRVDNYVILYENKGIVIYNTRSKYIIDKPW